MKSMRIYVCILMYMCFEHHTLLHKNEACNIATYSMYSHKHTYMHGYVSVQFAEVQYSVVLYL